MNPGLHPLMVTGLDMLSQDQPVWLLTRHSLREDPDNLMAGFAAPLTDEGIELARAWGAAISRGIDKAFSSHSHRCIDTATAMLEGAKSSEVEVLEGDLLCEPGCFVTDMKLAGSRFVELGPFEFVARLLRSEPVPGTRTAQEGSRILLNWMLEHGARPGRLSLFVTHDTILAGLVCHLAGLHSVGEEDWPWMMEGVFLWLDSGRLHWLWRGELKSIPWKAHAT